MSNASIDGCNGFERNTHNMSNWPIQILQETLDLSGKQKKSYQQESKTGKRQAFGTVGGTRVSHPHKGVRDGTLSVGIGLGHHRHFGKQIQLIEDFPDPQDYGSQGIIHGDDRQIRLLPKARIHALQQRSPAREYDTTIDNVARQL